MPSAGTTATAAVTRMALCVRLCTARRRGLSSAASSAAAPASAPRARSGRRLARRAAPCAAAAGSRCARHARQCAPGCGRPPSSRASSSSRTASATREPSQSSCRSARRWCARSSSSPRCSCTFRSRTTSSSSSSPSGRSSRRDPSARAALSPSSASSSAPSRRSPRIPRSSRPRAACPAQPARCADSRDACLPAAGATLRLAPHPRCPPTPFLGPPLQASHDTEINQRRCTVCLKGGETAELAWSAVERGCVVRLSAGESPPCDLLIRRVHGGGLRAREKDLTGESKPVNKMVPHQMAPPASAQHASVATRAGDDDLRLLGDGGARLGPEAPPLLPPSPLPATLHRLPAAPPPAPPQRGVACCSVAGAALPRDVHHSGAHRRQPALRRGGGRPARPRVQDVPRVLPRHGRAALRHAAPHVSHRRAFEPHAQNTRPPTRTTDHPHTQHPTT